jgi:kynureninase
MGHAAPFEFDRVYRPADGAQQLLCGTPPVLSLMALQVGVELIAEIGTARLRDKSVALTECFRRWIEPWAGQLGILWGSPVDPQQRGSHVALHHDQAYAIVQALIEQGVIGDFRMPDIVRLGFAAPYLRFVDVWDAAETLRRIMRERTWDRPEFHRRRRVT